VIVRPARQRAASVRPADEGAIMRPDHKRRAIVLALLLLSCTALSCRSTRNTRPYLEPPPPDIQPTVLAYSETDGFDNLFESALVNQDPVILIQTDTSQPDWGARLNAWIAAWNRGGKVVDEPRRRARMQGPLTPNVINGETLREFRLLVDDLMTRVEDVAKRGSSWWAEERIQRRRIDLLKPYSLRFHMDNEQKIQLIFFNGRYSRYYRQVMDSMSISTAEESNEWSRTVLCSHCKGLVLGSTAQRRRVRAEQAPSEE
jgi:hypothetical protein